MFRYGSMSHSASPPDAAIAIHLLHRVSKLKVPLLLASDVHDRLQGPPVPAPHVKMPLAPLTAIFAKRTS